MFNRRRNTEKLKKSKKIIFTQGCSTTAMKCGKVFNEKWKLLTTTFIYI